MSSESETKPTEDYQIPFQGHPVFPDYEDVEVSVPTHCLLRMFYALAHSETVRPGTTLERDILIADKRMCDKLKEVQKERHKRRHNEKE